MSISATTIAQYAPHGNAQLTFTLNTKTYTTDPSTGNLITELSQTETVDYLATLNLQRPNWKGESGVDNTTYACQGRLLTPAKLDPRITNGNQATAIINGYKGRFELVFDLTMDRNHYSALRQLIQGTFRVIGGKG
jgi:hypothetical protein